MAIAIGFIFRKMYCSSRRIHLEVEFCKKLVINFFSNFQTNHLCWSLFLDKLLAEYQQLYKIGTPAKDFSCVFYEIFNNFFFAEHLRVTHFTLHRIVFLRIHDGVIWRRKILSLNVLKQEQHSNFWSNLI